MNAEIKNLVRTLRSGLLTSPVSSSRIFKFATFDVKEEEIFFESKFSVAFVNYKPVLPGHVLVAPKRIVDRFGKLSVDEVQDVWLTCQLISRIFEMKKYHEQSFTFAIQDGENAGQTVPHMHVHIIPRKKNDFSRNDEIYERLESSGIHKIDNEERRPRSFEEMAEEAKEYRDYFAEFL